MARKQLDLEAPLISVRRKSTQFPSPPDRVNNTNNQKKPPIHRQQSLPPPKSENWELTEVTKPGAVPFLWEQSPGRPKPGSESESQSPVEPSNTPRLPPGWAPGTTPRYLSGEVYQDKNLGIHQTGASPIGDISALLESLNKEVYGDSGCDSEKDEDYSDALDALSMSMNFSVSGLSGYNSSTNSSEGQTREFMMSRFLPAAKAVAANTPTKKQSSASPARSRRVSKELVRVTKAVIGQKKPLFERQKSGSVGSHGGHSAKNHESEDEDYEEVDVNPVKISMKTRGFFSRFCLKNSLCLINPVPMMKMRTQLPPATPVKGVNRLARTAHSGPLTQLVDKSSEDTDYKQKLRSVARSQEFHTVKTKPTHESPRFSYSGDLRMARGPSPNRSLNRGGISPNKSPFRRGVGYGSLAKDAEDNNNTIIRPHHFPVVTRYKPKSVSGPIVPITEKIRYAIPVEESPRFGSRRMSNAEPFMQDSKASGNSNFVSQAERMENLRLELTRLRDNARIGRNSEHTLKEDGYAPPFSFSLQPPPLPNSPSESWLWRTLPSSTPLRNPKKQHDQEAPDAGGAKWETIVKRSNVHYDHVRNSEELVPRVPRRYSL